MKQKPNYYAIITADVRYDTTLTPNAKLLYAEITALCNMNGKCCASTSYFCELYEVSRISIQKWLKLLEDRNYIKRVIIYKQGSKQIETRLITLVNNPCNKKLTDNTTINNNNITYSNNKGISKLLEEVKVFDTTNKHKEDFLEYWLETNTKGKTKFQMQKTWNTNRRLKTWIKNYNNWYEKNNKKSMSKLDEQLNAWENAKKLL